MKRIVLGVTALAAGTFATILIPNAIMGLIISSLLFGSAAIVAWRKEKKDVRR